MRGFRGSRAAQNSMAFRHGNHSTSPLARGPQGQASQSHGNGTRPALPDWVKAPETRELEKRAGIAPVLPLSFAQTAAHLARSFEAKPQHAAATPARVAKVIPIAAARKKRAAAPAAAKAKKRVVAKKAKPASRSAARPKRKAA